MNAECLSLNQTQLKLGESLSLILMHFEVASFNFWPLIFYTPRTICPTGYTDRTKFKMGADTYLRQYFIA